MIDKYKTVNLEKWIQEIDNDFGKLISIKKFEIGQSNPTYK